MNTAHINFNDEYQSLKRKKTYLKLTLLRV